MSGNTFYTIQELQDTLGMSERTIYRYIDTFKAAGFAVEKVRGNVYRLVNMKRPYPDLSKIVYFSEEEAYIVNRLIDSLDNTNALKQGLHRKLAAIYDATSIADYVDKKSNSANIQALADAAKSKKMAVLKNYESSHSGDIRDRKVEPFAFTTNYLDVWCFDPEDGRNKRFKISRIDEVLVLDEPWVAEAEHSSSEIDAFRMSGPNTYHVRLQLSLQAKNLLLEEYPLAEKSIRKSGEHYIFDDDVRAMEGVGRFVIGLASDIAILDGAELRDYIRDFVIRHLEKV
jgi:predicted DNA-binding transcriptional regulator YafY